MEISHASLVVQLNVLLRLTSLEATTARSRIAQATTDDTRRELAENAQHCDERAAALRDSIAELGGVPDLVGRMIAKAGAAGKLPLEQAVPLTEALLGDLALEHQLFDRSRLVKVLAQQGKAPSVVRLAERLEVAHGATIDWLFTVLAETAIGGPAALAPTPTQAVAAGVRSTVTFVGGLAAKTANRTASGIGELGGRLQTSTSEAIGAQRHRATGLVRSAGRVLVAGRDAGLAATESVARGRSDGLADRVQALRNALGTLPAEDLVLPEYDSYAVKDAVDAVRGLDGPDELRSIITYERSHKNRSRVIGAAELRSREIADELVTH